MRYSVSRETRELLEIEADKFTKMNRPKWFAIQVKTGDYIHFKPVYYRGQVVVEHNNLEYIVAARLRWSDGNNRTRPLRKREPKQYGLKQLPNGCGAGDGFLAVPVLSRVYQNTL
ncbi:MAG: hypothetical protein ACI8Y7_000985 [Candidatus Woesearchaeota archaeon]|jgi:hypothetical protein